MLNTMIGECQAIIGIHCNVTMYLVSQNIPQTFTNFYIIIIVVDC